MARKRSKPVQLTDAAPDDDIGLDIDDNLDAEGGASPTAPTIVLTPHAIKRQGIRAFVRGCYDLQKLRIQMGNRICAEHKVRLGQAPSTSEKELKKEAKVILAKMRVEYKKITDGFKKFPTRDGFVGETVISDYVMFCLVQRYLELEANEIEGFSQLGELLLDFPIYTEWLSKQTGVGPALGGVIVSEFDIYRAKYPSSLWMYAGLDVVRDVDGRGRSKRKEHLVLRPYTDRSGKEKEKLGITYNPFLKTKLMGVLGSSFLRAVEKKDGKTVRSEDGKAVKSSPYAKVYEDYKHRLENHAVYGIANEKARIAEFKAKGQKYAPKGHRHMMATRYAVKRFLADLYVVWRKLEGLPVAPEYSVAKLGIVHSHPPLTPEGTEEAAA